MTTYVIQDDISIAAPAGIAYEMHYRTSVNIDQDGTTLQQIFKAKFEDFHYSNAARASQIAAAHIGEWHPYTDTAAWVDSVRVEQVEESSPVYNVIINYTNKTPRPKEYDDQTALEEQPFWYPNNFSYSFVSEDLPAAYDVYGNPIVNTAGDLFDPPVEVTVHDLVINVSKKVPFVNELLWGSITMEALMAYLGTVHGQLEGETSVGNAVLGGFTIAPYHGYIQDISSELQRTDTVDGEMEYMDLTVSVVVHRTESLGASNTSPGFRKLILSEGFQHYEEVETGVFRKVRAVDEEGENTSDPVLLDSDGTKLDVDASAPVGYFLLKEVYPYSNFRTLFNDMFGITQPV